MLTELTRLNSHLVWLGTHAHRYRRDDRVPYCFREREDILRIFEMFSGQRMMTSYFRIGGLALEPPRGWQKAVKKFIDIFPSKVDEYEEPADQQSASGSAAPRASGSFRSKTCWIWGVTGPMLRAAGLPVGHPEGRAVFRATRSSTFDVPTRTENDVYARYQVRMEEMRQSAQDREAGAGRNA